MEKTIDLSKVSDKLYHIMLYRLHLALSGTRTHNLIGDQALITQVVVTPTTTRSRMTAPNYYVLKFKFNLNDNLYFLTKKKLLV